MKTTINEIYHCFLRSSLTITLLFVAGFQAHAWETSHFVWNFGMISLVDQGFEKTTHEYFANENAPFNKQAYNNIKSGDVVFVRCRHIHQFYKEILTHISVPIVLLIADGDESFPSNVDKTFDVESLINNNNVIHIFAQNNDYDGLSSKVSHIPIGIDFHTIAYKAHGRGAWGERGSVAEQEKFLHNILKKLKPTHQRKKAAFVDFQLSDHILNGYLKRYLEFHETRQSIFERLLPTGLIHYGPRMSRTKLWEIKGQYAFSISPHGNGLDCHRTWEDLILGCIVIVKSSPLDPLYEGLPVVIIDDWSEITRDNMDIWLKQYGDAFTNKSYRQKLTNSYWFSKIYQKTNG